MALAEEWKAVRIPYEAGYALMRAAEAFMRGPNPDREGAARWLRDGYRTGTELGATRLVDDMRVLGRHARINLSEEASTPPPQSARLDRPHRLLTARELDVLRLLVEGLSNGEIGKELFNSTKTASTHVSSILRKMGASNRVEAATLAHRLGLVE